MGTISTLPVQRRTSGPVERMLSDALEAVAISYSKEVYERNYVTDAEIAAALRQPVSMASVLADVARWFGVEAPPAVEDALGSE